MNGTPARHDGAALLAGTAALGGYFAIEAWDDGRGDELAALVSDEATVRQFVDRTRSAVAASTGCDPSRIPLRMAASSFQLNVVARIVSPAVGAAALYGVVPVFTRKSVRWEATDHHSPRFGTTGLDWVDAPTPVRAAELISKSLLTNVVGQLNETLRATASLSARVSWGNTISAANGAVTVMALSRPDLEPAGRAVVRALLDTETLTDTGHFVGERFVRHSCCLFYQAPNSGLCQDCVLDATSLQRTRR